MIRLKLGTLRYAKIREVFECNTSFKTFASKSSDNYGISNYLESFTFFIGQISINLHVKQVIFA